MNYFKLLLIPFSAFGGGLLEFTFTDFYLIYIKKTRFFPRPLNSVTQLFNKGFACGIVFSLWYIYLKMPIINYYLYK